MNRSTGRKARQATTKGAKPKSRKGKKTSSYRKVVVFPHATGKTIDTAEFSTCPGFHAIILQFQDETELRFEIDTGFTLQATYSDWKTGNERAIRRWPPIPNAQ